MGNKKKQLDKTAVNDDHSSSIPSESSDTEMTDGENNTQFIDSTKIKQENDVKEEPLTDVELVEIPASTYRNVAHFAGSNGHQSDNDVDYLSSGEVKVELKKECNDKEEKESNKNDFSEEVPSDEQDQQRGEDDVQQPDSRNDANNTMERGDREHVNQSKPHKCELCAYSTRYKYNLKQHMLKHTGEKPHACDFCPKRYTDNRNLQAHMKTHVKELLFHCRSCLQGFNEKDTKIAHEASCMVLRYECHICKESFGPIRFNIINHMRIHSGDRPFGCNKCFKQFKLKSHLKNHMKLHDDPRSFHCSKCNQGFLREDEQIMHEEKCNRHSYDCYICGRAFGLNKSNLVDHMRIHTGEKPFECKQCSKKFTLKGNLKQHMKTHAKKLKFMCLICHRGFSKDDKRKAHQQNCNDRNYECHLCNKFFGSSKKNLVRHIRTHSGERPFQYHLCQTRFTLKQNLKRHMNQIHNKRR